MVVDALHAEEAELAPARGVDGGELGGGAGAALSLLLAADAGGGRGRTLVLGLVLL